jgi:transposase
MREEENGRLLGENQVLREQNAELLRLVAGLRGQVTELEGQLAAAEGRIAELEQGKKGPPSFVKPNKPRREGPAVPRRKRAEEQNHGRPRAKVVTRREEHHVERCPDCDCKLRKERVAWRREVIDLPPVPAVEVTEHVVFKGYCPRCAVWKYAEPAGEGQVIGRRRLGVRVMALIGYLSASLRLPCREIQEYLHTIHGLQLSVGAVEDLLQQLAKQGQPMVEELKGQIRQSAIVNADETGWREDGQNGYIWAFSTPGEQGVRYYLYDHSRGSRVVQEVLGEEFRGVLGTDYYSAYNVYPGPHQRCWAHLLRDLHALKEEHAQDGETVLWAQAVRALYDEAQAFMRMAPPRSEREQCYVRLVSQIEELGLLYAKTKHPCQALAKRLLRHQDELFQFVLVAGLAADNNLAERSLRPLVVVRKISGGTRSHRGSQTRMTLASIFGTWRARGLNPFTQCLNLLGAFSCA